MVDFATFRPERPFPGLVLKHLRPGDVDSTRLRMKGFEKLMGEMTLRNGQVVWDLNGMSSRDWDRVAK
jgi:hypothetical protein